MSPRARPLGHLHCFHQGEYCSAPESAESAASLLCFHVLDFDDMVEMVWQFAPPGLVERQSTPMPAFRVDAKLRARRPDAFFKNLNDNIKNNSASP